MGGNARFLSFPGTAHIPACRVREDSPHFGKFRRLANRLCDAIPDIEAGELRAYENEALISLPVRTGLMYNISYTPTIIRRIVESMGGRGRPCFHNRLIRKDDEEFKGTFMLPAFWDMIKMMRDERENRGFEDMMALEEQGVLVRSRLVPIAIRAPECGFYATEEQEVYLSVGSPIPIKNVIMLGASGAAGLLKEIIRAEAHYEAGRAGGHFFGQPEGRIRAAIANKFRYEVMMSLKDVEEPMDRLDA